MMKYHAFALQLQAFPPKGYEIAMTPAEPTQKLYRIASGWEVGWFLMQASGAIIPTSLARAWLNRWIQPPVKAAFSYSTDQLVFRKEPWVLEVECASILLGNNPGHLRRYGSLLKKMLSSPYCCAIRCWSEAGRRSLLADLGGTGFEHKIEVIPYAVPPRRFQKEHREGRVKILFVGSGSTAGGFDLRGGRETIEAFVHLRRQYRCLELVVRSDVPPDIKRRYGNAEGFTLLDTEVTQDALAREFRSADIFMIPSHNTSPMLPLDAMSYELPVVTTDSWANREYVEDGKTGLVVRGSNRYSRFHPKTHQPSFASVKFLKTIQTADPQVVDGLVHALRVLLDNPGLRGTLGKAGRWEVEHGRFCLENMNDKLGQMFDRAAARKS